MERTSTWNNVGVVASHNDFHTLLNQADLDYNVEARDIYTTASDGESSILIPGRKMIIREDTDEFMGIVSDRYQICQNRDALDFVQYIDGVTLQKAGSAGPLVWMIGKLPEITVLGDTISPQLIFQNSHDGSASIKTTICMLRIVCQNQFVSSFADSPATISIRHTGEIEEKIVAARETVAGVYDYLEHYDQFANSLVQQKVTTKVLNDIIEKYFKIPEDCSTRTMNFIQERKDQFYKAYSADDNQNFIGTKWGIINGFTDFITHEDYKRKNANWEMSRFLNSLNPNTTNEFINLVKEAA